MRDLEDDDEGLLYESEEEVVVKMQSSTSKKRARGGRLMKKKSQEVEVDVDEILHDDEGDTKRNKPTVVALSDDDDEDERENGRGKVVVDDVEVENIQNQQLAKIVEKSRIKSGSVLATLIQSDDLRALKGVLQNSSSKSKGGGNLVDVLLLAAIANAPKVTEFLIQTDSEALCRSSSSDDEEELAFDDHPASMSKEELSGVAISLDADSLRSMHLMRMGKRLLEPSAGSNSWSRTPFLAALYSNTEGIVKLYCRHMQAHAMAVLASTVPEDQHNDEPVPVAFDLLRPHSYFSLLVALRALGESLEQSRGSLRASTSSLQHFMEKTTIKGGSTFLHWASEQDETAIFLEQALELAPSLLYVRNKRGLSPLHVACACGAIEVVQIILKADSREASTIDEQGWSPFLYALLREEIGCAMLVLRAGHDDSSALYQLRLLGSLVQPPQEDEDEEIRGVSSASSRTDERVRKMISSLGTVREFRTLLNKVVRSNLSLLDEDLGYLLMYPSLLSLENKMLAARKALRMLDTETGQQREKYPMLFANALVLKPVLLHRGDPWSHLCHLVQPHQPNHRAISLSNPRQHIGSSSNRDVAFRMYINRSQQDGGGAEAHAADKAVQMFRSNVMFQFEGTGEEGLGQGVEREMIDSLCKGMLNGHSGPSSSTSTSTATNNKAATVINNGGANYRIFERGEIGGDEGHFPVAYSKAEHRPGSLAHIPPQDSKGKSLHVFGQLAGHFLLKKFMTAADAKKVKAGKDEATGDDITHLIGGNYLSVNLPRCFWSMVLGKQCSLEDLGSIDEGLLQSLKWVRDNDGADLLEIYFTAPAHSRGNAGPKEAGEVELVSGGKTRLVTDANKEEYLRRMVRHHTVGRMGLAAKVVRQGLEAVVNPLVVDLFSEQDLCVLLQGSSTINVADWENHTEYNSCGKLDRIIGWLWRLIREMSEVERAQLLSFCTGSTRLPVGGFSALEPTFTVYLVKYYPSSSLPTASTCFNMLKLPEYPTEAILRKNVYTAILYGSAGFSFT